MGLMDDILGVAKELSDIKTEVAHTIGDAVNDLTGLKDEATSAAKQLQDEATSVKDDLLGKVSDSTDNKHDNQE